MKFRKSKHSELENVQKTKMMYEAKKFFNENVYGNHIEIEGKMKNLLCTLYIGYTLISC